MSLSNIITGAGSGAGAGAAVGSLFGPGPGTLIGAGAGTLVGGLAGAFADSGLTDAQIKNLQEQNALLQQQQQQSQLTTQQQQRQEFARRKVSDHLGAMFAGARSLPATPTTGLAGTIAQAPMTPAPV